MIHRESYATLIVTALFILLLVGFCTLYAPSWLNLSYFISLALLIIVLQFFRNPTREIPLIDNSLVYAPADGKVVVIEETTETEYFKDKRIQISVFMSPINVHVNRNAIGGVVKYYRYHAGKYLVAWHPKSSTENERTTVVLDNGKTAILFRQIAGAMARRIVNYLKEGQNVVQGSEMGFIKFGSRVDIFLPLDAKIEVKIDDIVKGNKTILAKINK